MHLILAFALATAAAAAPHEQQQKFGETGGWSIESLQGGCSASRNFDKQRQTFVITRTQSGQIQLLFIADRWAFADAERGDFGLHMFTPAGRQDWQSLKGSEWSSGGAGFVRIAFDKDDAGAPLQALAASSRLEITRAGKQIARFDAPDTASAVLMLFRCVDAQRY